MENKIEVKCPDQIPVGKGIFCRWKSSQSANGSREETEALLTTAGGKPSTLCTPFISHPAACREAGAEKVSTEV